MSREIGEVGFSAIDYDALYALGSADFPQRRMGSPQRSTLFGSSSITPHSQEHFSASPCSWHKSGWCPWNWPKKAFNGIERVIEKGSEKVKSSCEKMNDKINSLDPDYRKAQEEKKLAEKVAKEQRYQYLVHSEDSLKFAEKRIDQEWDKFKTSLLEDIKATSPGDFLMRQLSWDALVVQQQLSLF